MAMERVAYQGAQRENTMSQSHQLQHPRVSRRTALQAGAVGLLGLGMNHLQALRAGAPAGGRARSCIYIFLTGGLAQHESFDLKPDAPAGIRGEFRPAATRTPGIQISEHLPGAAQPALGDCALAHASDQWPYAGAFLHADGPHDPSAGIP